MSAKICIVYSHHKLGDLIWQLPYIKAISEHHKNSVDLILRNKTQGKKILKDLNHIETVHYNNFRKGINYWIDVLKLFKIFFKNKYSYVYLLDKVNKPAIAAKLAGIRNIIGPGIKNQKKWLTIKNFLEDKDFKLNYSEQSQKLLKINKIQIKNLYPNLIFNTNDYIKQNLDILPKGEKIAFGVDSFENYKMWYEENFIELADKLSDLKIFDYIYLICGPDKSHISQKIIEISKKKYFIDCSQKNLTGVITALKKSKFFIGNNSGPLNLSAALGLKSFGLIANDPASELRYSKIIPITPDNYIDNIWNKKREGMKKLTVEKVYSKILENLN
jgi:ADP-heptose:LPS heptosyltransferase